MYAYIYKFQIQFKLNLFYLNFQTVNNFSSIIKKNTEMFNSKNDQIFTNLQT